MPSISSLLGFFWTSCKQAQFVVVSTHALHMFELTPSGVISTKASKERQVEANTDLTSTEILWYQYSFHCRLLLVGTQFELVVMQVTGQVRLLCRCTRKSTSFCISTRRYG